MSTARIASNRITEPAIELMTEHDLLEVIQIEETCGLSLWGWDGYFTELDRRESIMLVARMPEERVGDRKPLLGFIAARVNAGELHINNIGVREEARRFGVGSQLLRKALSKAKLYGAASAVLEVRGSNLAAQALYRRHGFDVLGRRKNYYKNPTEDALIMALDFGAAA